MKKTEWLIAQSFERGHDLLSAINTLSIHAKLTLAEIDDSARSSDVQQARALLATFLDRFEDVIQDAEHHRDGTVLGADPRFGQLARRYLSMKSRWPRPLALYSMSLPELRQLLAADRIEDLNRLIDSLHDLRALIEQHAHSDVVGLLGEI